MMKRAFVLMVSLALLRGAEATTYVVTSAGDTTATGTLRWAIQSVSTTPAPPHVIGFNLAPPYRILVTGALPFVQASTRVDGSTQPSFSGTPQVRINGGGIAGGSAALVFTAPSSTLRSVIVDNFAAAGVSFTGANAYGGRVEGCYIVSNANNGVACDTAATNNVIGGLSSSNHNVIAFNGYYGVALYSGPNTVQGNYIGVDVTGTNRAANAQAGVFVAAPGCLIGGSGPSARNVISGNSYQGVVASGSNAVGVVIAGNFIGLDATGTTNIMNDGAGVELSSAVSNRVGGATPAERNVISGNGNAGIHVSFGANYNTIQGNYIGSTSNGINPLGNGQLATPRHGIFVESSSFNQMVSNVVVANQTTGIGISGTGAVANVLYGNWVGLNVAGVATPNLFDGVGVNGAVSNLVGLAGPVSQRNVISGNAGQGVFIEEGSVGTIVQNNFIGTDPQGTNAVPNNSGVFINDSSFSVVGGGTGTGNVISGNNYAGVYINNTGSIGNRIAGNFIGTDVTGTKALPNGGPGLQLNVSTPGTVIGGGVPYRNVISGNGGNGLNLGNVPRSITISANYIGVGSNGLTRIANGADGISIGSCVDCVVGGAGVGNVVSGNAGNGLTVGSGCTNVQVSANIVGLDALGLTTVSNVNTGINVYDVHGLTVGLPGAGNWVAGNGGDGIRITASSLALTDAVVSANVVGLNTAGAPRPNMLSGLYLNGAVGIHVGGSSPSNRNVLSANVGSGLNAFSSPGMAIEQNYIGVSTSGLSTAANGYLGLIAQQCSNMVIQGNILASTNGRALYIYDECNNSIIRSNFIGVAADGVTPLSGGVGLDVVNSHDVQIGGYLPGQGNTIAHSTGPGIAISSVFNGTRLGNRVAGNVLYSNAIPIDLNDDGLTANDPAPDPDSGYANDFQNFPVLTNAFKGSTHVQGQLVTAPGTYRIDVMAIAPATAAAYLGYADLLVNGTGTQSFSVVLGKSAPTGALIAATATDAAGNTSELGPAVTNRLPPVADTDGDGMPDWWEDAHGLNAAVSNAPTADADGDGAPDLQEYFTDTDPTSSNSVLTVFAMAALPQRTVSWPSSDSRQYNVQYSTDLVAATWNTIVSNLPGTGFTMSQLDTNPPRPQVIYRVRGGMP